MNRVRVTVRVYVDGVIRSTDHLHPSEEELERLLPELAEKHALLCAERATMIELEFPDEPNPNERFFRIGSDPHGMVKPVKLALDPTRAPGSGAFSNRVN